MDSNNGTGGVLAVALKTKTLPVAREKPATSSSTKSPWLRWMLSRGRPGTIVFAARTDPTNWARLGMVVGRSEGTGDAGSAHAIESTSNSVKFGVLSRKLATF